eukprot:269209_1
MSFFEKVTDRISNARSSFQALPRWKQLSIGIVSIGIGYTIYKKLKPKKEEKELEYYPNVPHFTANKIVSCSNKLGECCIWDDRKQLLCWIDYENQQFWTYDPKTKQSKSYDLPEKPGSFALCEDGSLFFCFGSGPAFYDIETQTMSKKLYEFEPDVRSRMNDGRCDRNGRFICGGVVKFNMKATNIFTKTIQMFENIYIYNNHKSSIHRINTDLSHQVLVRNVLCSNSICFSIDGKTMYYTDSFARKINKLDYYNDERIPDNEQIFSDKYKGFADGSCVDGKGNIWNASFGIGKVTCFNEKGDVIMVVDVPEKCVTCCAFGGENMNVLFITTLNGSMFGLGKSGGDLYAIELPIDVKGCKENRFKGTPLQLQ